ncbi:MAG: 16S rRNA (adenine(1518)-N(6)/adenine(1519)-N(6))-dimethyltransferase RsmA [Candidatus Hydrogenedentota bacterium]
MRRNNRGQHILIEKNIFQNIIELLPTKYSEIIEIGPGPGNLTELLCKTGRPVIAIEIDKKYKKRLDNLPYPNLSIIYEDVLRLLKNNRFPSKENSIIAGNLPYYITKEIFRWLFSYSVKWYQAILMVQKEVALRLMAKPGNRDYGILTIFREIFAAGKMIKIIKPQAFRPQPRVDSAIIWLEKREKPLIEEKNIKKFSYFIKTAFAERRKIILNNLVKIANKDEVLKILEKNDIDILKRPENLTITQYVRLFDEFINYL